MLVTLRGDGKSFLGALTMSILSAPPQIVNPDSRQVPYAGHWINGAELARIRSASHRAYLSRTGSPYAASVDAAMDAAGRAELARVLAEHDAEFDRQADESAMCGRYESGYCC